MQNVVSMSVRYAFLNSVTISSCEQVNLSLVFSERARTHTHTHTHILKRVCVKIFFVCETEPVVQWTVIKATHAPFWPTEVVMDWQDVQPIRDQTL